MGKVPYATIGWLSLGGLLLLGASWQLIAVTQQWSLRQTATFYAEPETIPTIAPYTVPKPSPLLPANALTDAGYLLLQEGLQAPLSQKADLFRQAAKTLTQSLQQNPQNPYAHAYLAQVQALLRRSPGTVLNHLRQSVKTGPHEEKLLLWRSRVALSYWRHLSLEDKQALVLQLRHAWQYRWYSTTLLLAEYRKGEVLLGELSADDQVKFQEQYDKFLAQ